MMNNNTPKSFSIMNDKAIFIVNLNNSYYNRDKNIINVREN